MFENEKENKIRAELEEITRTLVQVNNQLDELQVKIDKCPAKNYVKLKELCSMKDSLLKQKEYYTKQHQEKVNLLNIVK